LHTGREVSSGPPEHEEGPLLGHDVRFGTLSIWRVPDEITVHVTVVGIDFLL
jgi:hypothetical protein